MDYKNNVALFSIIFLVVGILIGWLIWGNNRPMDKKMMDHNMHQMPDGKMMDNGSMSHTMMGMMDGLAGKTGDDFDQAFLSEMIIHHQGAVEMAQAVLKTSKRPELIKLANDIISAQNGEIKMMQDWKSAWFK